MDLSVFEEMNKRKKVPWEERLALINETFSSATRLDWYKAFEDVDLFGRILRDILKVDQSQPGRSGPRPVLDKEKARERLKQFMGVDYSGEEFQQAFKHLAAGRSVRQLAHKTGLDRNIVQKLLSGARAPDLISMEMIAQSFGKDPAYFLEYRTVYVLGALGERMVSSPEMTVDLYKRLRRKE